MTAITKQRLSGFVGTALPFDDITMLARSNATETGGSLSPCLAAQPSRGRLVLLSLNHQTASGRIAFLSALAASDHGAQARLSALQQGLNELGWVEGRNLRLDFRWGIAERDQMQELASELVELKPDVILGMTTPAVTALVQETKTIPHRVREHCRSARPRFDLQHGSHRIFKLRILHGGKWLETLKQIAPSVRRVAVLFNPQTAPYANAFMQVAEAAARSLGIPPIAAGVHDDGELERTMADLAPQPGGGLIILPDAFTVGH